MADVKWIKIATEIFDNQKIRLIESMPEGDTVIVIWFKLLMLAGKTNDSGLVYFTQDLPYTEQMLATVFNRPLTVVQMALNTFEKFGMIEIVDELIHVSNWEEYQNVDGLEKIREQTRKRVQKHRELKRLECNVTGNATVTQCNDIDIDKEIDKEGDKDIEVANAPIRGKKPAKVYTEDKSLNDAIKDFVGHRRALKKPMTDRAIELLLNKLDKMADTTAHKVELINNAIEHGWLTVYPIKDEKQTQQTQKSLRGDEPTQKSKDALKSIEAMYMQNITKEV